MVGTIVVVQKNDHSLGYYDVETGAETGRVTLDSYPHEFAVTVDGRTAYVCHFGLALAEDEGPGGDTVSVVDIAARRRSGSLACGAYRRPHGIALDAAGAVYALSEGASMLMVARDPGSGRFDSVQPTGGDGSHIVCVTGDGRLALSSNMRSNTVTALRPGDPEAPPVVLPSGARPEGSVLDAEERRAYVVCRESAEIMVIDLHNLTIADPIRTAPGPVRIARDRHGRLLVPLYHGAALSVIDPARPDDQRQVPLPDKAVSIGYDADSETALVSTLGDRLCLVDLASMQVARVIRTRSGPDPAVLVRH